MTRDYIRSAGMALFGPDHWQRPLARFLGHRDDGRFLRRVLAGERPIPPQWQIPLYEALQARRGEIDQLLSKRP